MARRSTKFYRKNEADVMSALGFKPTVNSGAGWIEKEDGQNDFLIAQLKSTDAASISIKQKDIQILEHNAVITHKVPCFVIQFLNDNSVFVMARPEDLEQVVAYINTGKCEANVSDLITEGYEVTKAINKVQVKTSKAGRESFWKQKEKEQEAWKRRSKQK